MCSESVHYLNCLFSSTDRETFLYKFFLSMRYSPPNVRKKTWTWISASQTWFSIVNIRYLNTLKKYKRIPKHKHTLVIYSKIKNIKTFANNVVNIKECQNYNQNYGIYGWWTENMCYWVIDQSLIRI